MSLESYEQLTANCEAETEHLASRLAKIAAMGDVITLSGDLGAGKTVFARAFICALGEVQEVTPQVHELLSKDSEVPSPTFTLVQSYYLNPIPVHHFALYRLENPEDAFELGIEDLFSQGISLIEWPERLKPYLPKDRLEMSLFFPKFMHETNTTRQINLMGVGDWEPKLTSMFQNQNNE